MLCNTLCEHACASMKNKVRGTGLLHQTIAMNVNVFMICIEKNPEVDKNQSNNIIQGSCFNKP